MGERELSLVSGLLALSGWLVVLGYVIAWLVRYRREKILHQQQRARALFAAAVLLVSATLVAAVRAGGFPELGIVWLSAAALCGIHAGELSGFIRARRR